MVRYTPYGIALPCAGNEVGSRLWGEDELGGTYFLAEARTVLGLVGAAGCGRDERGGGKGGSGLDFGSGRIDTGILPRCGIRDDVGPGFIGWKSIVFYSRFITEVRYLLILFTFLLIYGVDSYLSFHYPRPVDLPHPSRAHRASAPSDWGFNVPPLLSGYILHPFTPEARRPSTIKDPAFVCSTPSRLSRMFFSSPLVLFNSPDLDGAPSRTDIGWMPTKAPGILIGEAHIISITRFLRHAKSRSTPRQMSPSRGALAWPAIGPRAAGPGTMFRSSVVSAAASPVARCSNCVRHP